MVHVRLFQGRGLRDDDINIEAACARRVNRPACVKKTLGRSAAGVDPGRAGAAE